MKLLFSRQLLEVNKMLVEIREKSFNAYQEIESFENNLDIKGEYATAVFRITQEALTNIIRHADAKHVKIQVKLVNSNILLTVHDDGKGFKKHLLTTEKTFGVFGMQERAAMLGGEMQIISTPDKGTRINVSLPLKYN